VACGGACCAGTGCCPGGCQTVHDYGVGQHFFDCLPLGTLSLASAQAAAAAWAPTGGTDYSLFFSGDCVARQTAAVCATWCFTGTFAGLVKLNTVSLACLSPDTSSSPTWR
jgi:hypothetical protein